MTRIYTSIIIHKPVAQVFDFVTTASSWPQWHPSSLGVTGTSNHSGQPGDQVTEEFLVAGRRGQAVWTVRERAYPQRWVIDGQVGSSGGGTVAYTLTWQNGSTKFEREFTYRFRNILARLLDRWLIRPRIEAESTEALRRLKQVLEIG
jgi:hypothetical protein